MYNWKRLNKSLPLRNIKNVTLRHKMSRFASWPASSRSLITLAFFFRVANFKSSHLFTEMSNLHILFVSTNAYIADWLQINNKTN